MLCQLLESLPVSQFEQSVVSLRGEGVMSARVRAASAQLTHLNMAPRLPNPLALLRLCNVIRRTGPHVVQSWMYHANAAASICVRIRSQQTPVIWGIRASLHALHDYPLTARTGIRLGRVLSERPWGIIYNSKVAREQHTYFGYAARNARTIPNGIDCAKFVPDAHARVRVRSELSVPDDVALIGLFARYDPMKNHAGFMDAARRLIGVQPGVHFILAGEHMNQANATLVRLMKDMGLSGKVSLLGERSDCNKLMAAVDIACSSSSYGEGFPTAVAEAMACAVPCVVTDVGDSAYVIGDTGYVVHPRDPVALSEAWIRLLRAGTGGREVLGRLARERVTKLFDLASMVHSYEELYLEAGASPQTTALNR